MTREETIAEIQKLTRAAAELLSPLIDGKACVGVFCVLTIPDENGRVSHAALVHAGTTPENEQGAAIAAQKILLGQTADHQGSVLVPAPTIN